MFSHGLPAREWLIRLPLFCEKHSVIQSRRTRQINGGAELSRNNQDILEMTFAVQSPFFCLVESWVAPGLQSSGTAGENLIEPRKSIHSFLKLA